MGKQHGNKDTQVYIGKMNIGLSDKLELEIKDNAIILKKEFKHKTFEERLEE